MIVTRFHNVEKLEFNVEFLSPTFLGGADQNAEIRSPPFKNLLRQWWRVVHGDLDANTLRIQEGEVFGTVLGNENAVASSVRLSLLPGDKFQIKDSMPSIGKLEHPEVKNRDGRLIPLDRLLYLGYGPVNQERRDGRYQLVFRRFISPGSNAMLRIYCPKSSRDDMVQSASLIRHFGTIGGRSRNGFGSVDIGGPEIKLLADTTTDVKGFDQIMAKATKKYPTALAKDAKGLLCWEYGANGATWEKIFQVFSDTYMRVRTSFPFRQGNVLESRHILGYPAGAKHKVREWGGSQGRMPSQLRLMVKRSDQGQVIGRVLHLPHPVPKQWDNKLGKETDLWQKVHQFLDSQKELQRCGGGR
jgi:CRISPR-associated protein Cmr1